MDQELTPIQLRAKAELERRRKGTDEASLRVVRLDWEPLPKQKLALENPAFETLFGGAAGGGKALSVDTPIATPWGFRKMGELQVGDRVFHPSGATTRIVAATDFMHHECYRLIFDDGAAIIADVEHLWKTFDAKDLAALTRRDPEWREQRRSRRPSRAASANKHRSQAVAAANSARRTRVLDAPSGKLRVTAELAATLHTETGRTNHAIPVAESLLQGFSQNCAIEAYLLGLWLGDGSSQGARFTTADTELLEPFTAGGYTVKHYSGPHEYGITGGFKQGLRELGVLGNKHIPDQYLWAPEDCRLAMLQGLMDTDGTVIRSGSAEFCNTNYRLVEGVAHLIRSLGMKVTVRAGEARLRGKSCGPKWTLKFKANRQVFRLKRKADRLVLATRRTTKFHYLVNAEYVGAQWVRCIQVEALDGMYLAGEHLIPTHNSDLLVAMARLYHRKCVLFRRAFPDLERSLILRSTELYGDRAHYNAGKHVWTWEDTRQRIEFAHLKDDNAVYDHQSAAYDLVGFDEVTQFTRFQYIYLFSRARSTERGQRVRIIACTNPGNEGNDWVMERWAAWLDEGYPNPAQAGEVRYFKIDPQDPEGSKEVETDKDDPLGVSRTFIPSTLDDNPYLPDEYRKQLSMLPEPWRSQLRDGKWTGGLFDDPFQIVPTEWIRLAQARWRPQQPGRLSALGVDAARGGQDKTVLAPRSGNWIGPLSKTPGRLTPTGYSVLVLILPYLMHGGLAVLDVIGIGSAVQDAVNAYNDEHQPAVIPLEAINVSSPSTKTDKSGKIRMVNLRAYLYWKLREALDPEGDVKLALPPDPELLGELRATKWETTARGVKIVDKEEIKDRLGRSPNCADAVTYSLYEKEKAAGGKGMVF